MKAFVMKEIGQVGFVDKPIPLPGPGDAIVRTASALIRTSDTHTVKGGIGPRDNLTLGHEGVGVVHEVGSEVTDLRPGDRVLAAAITPAWGSSAAQNGYPSQSGAPLGGFKFANSKDGVFAEYFHVNDADANLAKIPARCPTRPQSTAPTCSRPASWGRRRGTSPSVGRSSCSPRGRWG